MNNAITKSSSALSGVATGCVEILLPVATLLLILWLIVGSVGGMSYVIAWFYKIIKEKKLKLKEKSAAIEEAGRQLTEKIKGLHQKEAELSVRENNVAKANNMSPAMNNSAPPQQPMYSGRPVAPASSPSPRPMA